MTALEEAVRDEVLARFSDKLGVANAEGVREFKWFLLLTRRQKNLLLLVKTLTESRFSDEEAPYDVPRVKSEIFEEAKSQLEDGRMSVDNISAFLKISKEVLEDLMTLPQG